MSPSARINPDDWDQLRSVIEDGAMRFADGDPDRLVLKLAPGFEIDWSLAWIIDDVVDTIETFGAMEDAEQLAAYLERQSKRIRRALEDMEAS